MQRTESVTFIVCDFCEREHAYFTCYGTCGRSVCSGCSKIQGNRYDTGVYSSMSPAFYCPSCEKDAFASNDPEYTAYRDVSSLSKAYRAYMEAFEERRKKVESLVERFRNARYAREKEKEVATATVQ